MAVITAGEFDNLAAFGISACYTDRGHDGLGAGVDEAHLIHRRNGFLQHLSQLDLKLRGCSVQQPVFCCLCNRRSNMGMGMAGNYRSIGGQIVYVFIAVFVPEAGAPGPFHEDRSTAANGFEGTGGTVDASDDMLQSFLVQMFRGGTVHN
ncbi:hypothetical protein D3C74_353160 [compost metagenome]